MHCPSCGAELQPDTRLAHLVVCEFCDSAIVLDEKAARVSGKMAVLAQTPGPLYVGGTGRLMERDFAVLGRVRYGYSKGYWDEWYLAFEDGSAAWISEDENEFTLETAAQEESSPIDYAAAEPGGEVKLSGMSYRIREKEIAECEGGEGQLPFAILSGEKVPFLDLEAGEQTASIEFDIEQGTCRLFRGRPLDVAEIAMDLTAEEAGLDSDKLEAERAAGKGKRERIVRGAEGDERSLDIKCFSCGAPLQIPSPDAESMECEYCGSELDLTLRRVSCESCGATIPLRGGSSARSVTCSFCQAQMDVSAEKPSVLGSLKNTKRPKVPFKLGQKATFDGVNYELVGHIRYRDGIYSWDEFMLYNLEAGYRWLIMEEGHFGFGREIRDNPGRSWFISGGEFLDRTWKPYERGKGRIAYVDGELPWIAAIGDEIEYADVVSPPFKLGHERSSSEEECFYIEYLAPTDVAKAFNMQEKNLPTQIGVAGHQPYPAGPLRRQSKWVFVAAAVVCAGLAVQAFFSGTRIGTVKISPEQYQSEYITEPFQITAANSVCKTTFFAPVDNSWVYLDMAVLNEKGDVLLDFSEQISYYHGYSGGEHWREGSKDESVTFKLKEPGQYRFLVLGQAGQGNHGTDTLGAGKTVTAKIYQGVTIARYYIIAAGVCIGLAAIEFGRRAAFEARRMED